MTAIEDQLLALRECQATVLVTNTEEDLVLDVRVDDALGRLDLDDQQMVFGTVEVNTSKESVSRRDRRYAEVERRLQQRIAPVGIAIRTFDVAVAQADDHGPAAGVGEPDQHIRKGPCRDPRGLAVKPLVLRDLEERRRDVWRVELERAFQVGEWHLL